MAPEIVQALKARYSMDNNWLYFWEFLGGAVRFDFGPSFTYNDWTCAEIIAAALPVSALIGAAAILLAIILGVPIGVISAVRRHTWIDSGATVLVLGGLAVPTFVTGSVLLTLFAVKWNLAPVGGWGRLSHIPLPVITLALPYAAYLARLTRNEMIVTLSSDYVRTAIAKGCSRKRAILRHAIKPALLPVLSYLGPATAQAMTGSFVVEKVFGVPGLGQHFVNAALNLDSGLILGTVLVFSTLLVTVNLLVDLLYAKIDPRIAEAI
jgi:oligopeptide transport system permease protein